MAGMTKKGASDLAMTIAYTCVRNCGPLEDLFHEARTVQTLTGDYSDVKVITPEGEFSWNEVQHISDKEMKLLMIRVTDAIYTLMLHPETAHPVPHYWQRPKDLLETSVD